ncbi:MAG: ArnT family glycosyltransferase [Candidatus Dormibacteria bacterium]
MLALAILAGAAFLRLHNLNQVGLNSDEAVYAGQAAGLAGFTQYQRLFGLFRAHPLMIQLIVAAVYRVTGVSGLTAREVMVGFGVALVLIVGLCALVLWGRIGALIAMLFVAVSQYPIAVSRQILLDGPEAVFVACCLLFFCLYVRRGRVEYLWAATFSAGLAFLSKETAILLVPAVLAFFILAPEVVPRRRPLAIAIAIYVVTILPYPLAELGAGKAGTGGNYLAWQVLRPANHDLLFYLGVFGAIGWAITGLAVLGIVLALRRRSPTDLLLLSFTLVVFAFLELWPTKGYEYLVPLVAPVTLLAVSGVTWLASAVTRAVHTAQTSPRHTGRGLGLWIPGGLTALTVVSMFFWASPVLSAQDGTASLVGTDSGQQTPTKVTVLAGSGGLLAGRPTGLWVKTHTLRGSSFLTIGPTFANVLQFYSLDRAVALSVSPDPLHRNPSYAPVTNADKLIRSGAVQYLVYDAYSAARSQHFANRLLALAHKFEGQLVYQYDRGRSASGERRALVLIYEVQP